MAASPSLGGVGRTLSHKNFRRYWYGMTVSTAGFWGYRVALAWYVWELTHSPTWLGLVAFAEMVPMVLLGPIAGAIIDRTGSLIISRLAQSGWSVAIGLLGALIYFDLAPKEVVLLLSILQGCVSAFSNPSHLALVAKLVPKEDLAPAIAMQSGTVQTGRFIGPALAGPLLALHGPALVIGLVAIGFLFFVTMLLLVRTLEPERPSPSTQGVFRDFADGVRYAANHRGIRIVLVFTAIMAILLRPLPELMPGFADKIFGRGAEGLAWLLAGFGFGAMLSALWIAFRGRAEGLVRVYSVNLGLGAGALLAFGFTSDFRIGLGLVALFGFATNTVSIASQTLVQYMVAGGMRARVMALLGITFRGVPALGALFQGLAASAFGLAVPIVIAAFLCLAAWIPFARLTRHRDFS